MKGDPEVRARARSVFARLALISEAPTSSFVKTGSRPKASSTPPNGARLSDLRSDRPPPRDRSLYDFYLWHLLRAKTDYQRIRIINEAETAYHRSRVRIPKPDLPPDNDAAMRQVVEDYEGLAPGEVARLLGSDDESLVPWIMKARRTHGRKATDGRPRRPWEKWSLRERQEEIGRMRESGLTQNEIAGELEISVRTVQRYL